MKYRKSIYSSSGLLLLYNSPTHFTLQRLKYSDRIIELANYAYKRNKRSRQFYESCNTEILYLNSLCWVSCFLWTHEKARDNVELSLADKFSFQKLQFIEKWKFKQSLTDSTRFMSLKSSKFIHSCKSSSVLLPRERVRLVLLN